MPAIYDQLTEEQQLALREYIRITVKQGVSTTGQLSINSDEDLVIDDVHARFQTNEVQEGDTVEFFATTPPSISPVGSFEVLEVVSETSIKVVGKAKPLGVHAKYRVINTSGIQTKINAQYSNLAFVMNVDKVDALKQEAINVPWYTRATGVALQYFAERSALDGYIFFYPVTQTDLDHVTLVPQPALPPPFDTYGPLLYPFSYTGFNPDRRPGSPYIGLGTPSLLGLPDTSPPAIPADHTEPPAVAPIPINSGELNALDAEDTFYSIHSPGFPIPGYSATEIARLNSIHDAQEAALLAEEAAINALIPIINQELTDLRERGVLNTGFYASLTVARSRLTTALAQAVYARTNATDGLPAITTSAAPTAARLNFIQNVRPQQISNRVTQILTDQAYWIIERYAFLARRVNPSEGSLTLLRQADSNINDINNMVNALLEERRSINYVIGVNQ